MQAVIFGLMMPVVPLFIWKLYHRDKRLTAVQIAGRYVVYTLLTALCTSVGMLFLCDEGTSFMEKMDRIPSFALKYIFLEAVITAVIAAAEWIGTSGKIKITVDWEGYRGSLPARICRKFLFPAGLFLLAALVVYMNSLLMNDNVVWGDEAYTCNAIRNGLDGIFQILTLEENHPPLHFLWLKAFAELFGYTIPVYHFASFVPFCVGIVLAVTLLRKRYGNIPAAFFVILSGLSAPCVEYNMEIRMYALAFLGVAGCYYCVSRILSVNRAAGWIGMVFWACVAAYSHYYALVAVGIMMFAACVAAWLHYRGRTWIRGLAAMAVFAAAYAPWLSQVFRATRHISGHWWMTEIESLRSSLTMVGCGASMYKVVLLVLAFFALVMFLSESSIFHMEKKEKITVSVVTPSVREWSDETYTFAVGMVTIAGTLAFAYLLSVVMQPMVTGRYFYPLCAVTAVMLAVGSKRMFDKLEKLGKRLNKNWLAGAGKCAVVLLLAFLLVRGFGDYRTYRAVAKDENEKTAQTLYIIGEPGENTQFVNNGIQHIGWTVLNHYYPDTEVVNGNYYSATAEDVWYFSPGFLDEDDREKVAGMGYNIAGNYGDQQLGKYPFLLYHFVKAEPQAPAQQ